MGLEGSDAHPRRADRPIRQYRNAIAPHSRGALCQTLRAASRSAPHRRDRQARAFPTCANSAQEISSSADHPRRAAKPTGAKCRSRNWEEAGDVCSPPASVDLRRVLNRLFIEVRRCRRRVFLRRLALRCCVLNHRSHRFPPLGAAYPAPFGIRRRRKSHPAQHPAIPCFPTIGPGKTVPHYLALYFGGRARIARCDS